MAENWIQKADMPIPRLFFSVATTDGHIYTIGGTLAEPVDFVDAYEPNEDKWVQKASLPTARAGVVTSVVNGKIYAIGGWSAQSPALGNVEEYNPATDTWTKKTDMPTPRSFFAATAVAGKIYAIGGIAQNVGPVLSTIEEYNPATDTWTKKTDMPTPRSGMAAASIDGKIYLIGGTPAVQGPVLATVQEYDPNSDTWAEKAAQTGYRSPDHPNGLGPIAVHAEDMMLPVCLNLSQLYDVPLHIVHVSRRSEIELIRRAKERGLPVTCEVTPHHLLLSTDDLSHLGVRGDMRPRLATPGRHAARAQPGRSCRPHRRFVGGVSPQGRCRVSPVLRLRAHRTGAVGAGRVRPSRTASQGVDRCVVDCHARVPRHRRHHRPRPAGRRRGVRRDRSGVAPGGSARGWGGVPRVRL